VGECTAAAKVTVREEPSVGCVSESTVGEHPVACSEGVPAIPNIGVRFLGHCRGAGRCKLVRADKHRHEEPAFGVRWFYCSVAVQSCSSAVFLEARLGVNLQSPILPGLSVPLFPLFGESRVASGTGGHGHRVFSCL